MTRSSIVTTGLWVTDGSCLILSDLHDSSQHGPLVMPESDLSSKFRHDRDRFMMTFFSRVAAAADSSRPMPSTNCDFNIGTTQGN